MFREQKERRNKKKVSEPHFLFSRESVTLEDPEELTGSPVATFFLPTFISPVTVFAPSMTSVRARAGLYYLRV